MIWIGNKDKLLIEFAKWFNETQWKGGKGDANKILFCKSDYNGIVKLFKSKKK